MMKVTKLCIPFLMVSWTSLLSQQLSHQVIVPLAGIVSDNKVSYSQTVGETAVEIVGCHDYIFTQGFQQPGIKQSDDDQPEGTGAKVYPNPANEYLTVELFGESARELRIEIIDITGTAVITDKKSFNCAYWFKERYNVENLVKGFYLVRVLTEDGFLNRTFKIEKI
ncbi:MAG: T9SS type A sorting domain-containing protein [Bacteroidota bacterium]